MSCCFCEDKQVASMSASVASPTGAHTVALVVCMYIRTVQYIITKKIQPTNHRTCIEHSDRSLGSDARASSKFRLQAVLSCRSSVTLHLLTRLSRPHPFSCFVHLSIRAHLPTIPACLVSAVVLQLQRAALPPGRLPLPLVRLHLRRSSTVLPRRSLTRLHRPSLLLHRSSRARAPDFSARWLRLLRK